MDLFNKKLKKKLERKPFYEKLSKEEQKFFINILKTIKNESDLNYIIDYEARFSSFKEQLIIIKKLYDLNPKLCIYYMDAGFNLKKENIECLNMFSKEILDLNLSNHKIYNLLENKDKFLKYKNLYSNALYQKIILNYGTYKEILENENITKFDEEILINYPEEIIYILKQQEEIKEYLINIINSKDINKYLAKKDIVEQVNNKIKMQGNIDLRQEKIIKFLIYTDFNNNIVNEMEKLRGPQHHILSDTCDQYFNYIINNSENINDIKNAIECKYFGGYPNELIAIILENKDIQTPDIINQINVLNTIRSTNDIAKIREEVSKFKLTWKEIQEYLFNNKIILKKEYEKTLYNPENDNSPREIIDYNGSKIQYIKSDKVNFDMLITRMSEKRIDTSPNGQHVEKLLSDPSSYTDESLIGSDIISASHLSDINLDTFLCCNLFKKNDIILGFSSVINDVIIDVKEGDAGSKMEGNGSPYIEKSFDIDKYFKLSKIRDSVKTHYGYNQISISRRNENGQKKSPNFVLILKNVVEDYETVLNESALKYASYYNIPIVEIDGEKIFKDRCEKMKEKMDQEFLTYSDFEEMFNYLYTFTFVDREKKINLNEVVDCIIKKMSNKEEQIKVVEEMLNSSLYSTKTKKLYFIINREYLKNKLTQLKELNESQDLDSSKTR